MRERHAGQWRSSPGVIDWIRGGCVLQPFAPFRRNDQDAIWELVLALPVAHLDGDPALAFGKTQGRLHGPASGAGPFHDGRDGQIAGTCSKIRFVGDNVHHGKLAHRQLADEVQRHQAGSSDNSALFVPLFSGWLAVVLHDVKSLVLSCS